ncbi:MULTISPECIES: polysaccharide biosynthesis protein [Aerococcus]|uniref:Polysaccharide biosynthesis protein n=1 Tax=Aerococcus sanguinicola TaxID=119206 RepID=A0A5N1GN83_9LACT|nr:MULTISPECIES: polysaccharide biosynthesis protein [Aerococcus]KAA9302443.1 polysaccharide biosynthesis protein [Aerococcus sanguinicola]MDK6369817.1 polysaccharide biosynthesis protein [Aerococcus sp. UMB9870]MDK6680457.1 polysaccharide biosynthesis protein [Aerococcus sp. UMB8608]MDK6687046.1 polysaccharide biosynthesis protein [Aerococcus sp. UMB8623]MDK6940265.1 polysaccharide biosynthesis protein [Aerococcus sp. UMB8487]
MKDPRKNIAKGAFLLTLAGIIAKILSAVYRVPFQNIVGDEGFYVYQQVYPIYGIGMTFSLSGLPNFIGRQIAFQSKLKHRRVFIRRYSLMMLVFASLCFALTYFGAGALAQAMGDPLLTPVIRSVSFMFLFMPVLMILRGTFQAYQVMLPVALSQIIEQVVRVAVILLAAVHFVHLSTRARDYYQMGAQAMQGAWLAALAASLVLVWALGQSRSLRRFFNRPKPRQGAEKVAYHLRWSYLIKEFLTEGLLLCCFASLLVFFQLVDSFTLYEALVNSGWSDLSAKLAKGVYDRGQPLVQLGMVLAVAFSSSYLPALTQSYIRRQEAAFVQNSRLYLRLTSFVSLLVTTGLISIMPQINHLLFSDRSGSGVLAQYVLMIVLASLVTGLANIYQAQARSLYVAFSFILGLSIKMAVNTPLVAGLGSQGAVWASLLALLAMFALLYSLLKDSLRSQLALAELFCRTLPLCLLMLATNGLVLSAFGQIFGSSRLMDSLGLVLGMVLGVGLTAVYMHYVAILTEAELLSLPLGQALLKWIKVKK